MLSCFRQPAGEIWEADVGRLHRTSVVRTTGIAPLAAPAPYIGHSSLRESAFNCLAPHHMSLRSRGKKFVQAVDSRSSAVFSRMSARVETLWQKLRKRIGSIGGNTSSGDRPASASAVPTSRSDLLGSECIAPRQRAATTGSHGTTPLFGFATDVPSRAPRPQPSVHDTLSKYVEQAERGTQSPVSSTPPPEEEPPEDEDLVDRNRLREIEIRVVSR